MGPISAAKARLGDRHVDAVKRGQLPVRQGETVWGRAP